MLKPYDKEDKKEEQLNVLFLDVWTFVYKLCCSDKSFWTYSTEPVYVNVYGDQESIPRNRFRQPM